MADISKNNPATKETLAVIGGGAAGFFCAVNAARLNPLLKVIILEKSSKLLAKVKVSGGGRCNVTHACFDIPELVKRYPRGQNFLKKSFHWFNTSHTIQWFSERGVKLKAETDGRMFPVTDNSQTIIDCLLKEADKYGVEIKMNFDVKEITHHGSSFTIHESKGNTLEAGYICLASGGGPASSRFDWLKKLGHTVEEPVPSLFTFNIPNSSLTQLMGVSVEQAIVKIQSTKLTATGPLLITHWGLSGPAVLKLSAWGARQLADCNYTFTAIINWVPRYNEQSLRSEWPVLRNRFAGQKLNTKNPFDLPGRLWLYLLQQSLINDEQRWAGLSSNLQNRLIQNLTAQTLQVKGKTTFKEEFVTCGGIKLAEVNANTMQSKIIPNLFFAGEIIDVDGITGGFNFQNAWTSGFIAAKHVAGLQ
ncbi:MAG TPA: NAD(P)/FAD-dependent oxidoreductase [Panacibacter sp.]|nr:NAD(P)/FAD-dependent oxidoreductase [Panacibacter sp.]